jgi:sugar phosphate permease
MSNESMANNSNAKPTKVRYLIVTAATLMAFLLYLDRFCVSFAQDYIRQDLGLTQSQMSWFISAFFWSYALAQVPAGWMSDRYGARIMLVIYILTWSFFTALIGASTTFFMLIASRLACGLGQAGAYPTSASVVGRWMPITARGTASSIVANGGRIGGAMAPILTAFLIVWFVPMGTPVELKDKDVLKPRDIVYQSVGRRPMTDQEAKDLKTFLEENIEDQRTKETVISEITKTDLEEIKAAAKKEDRKLPLDLEFDSGRLIVKVEKSDAVIFLESQMTESQRDSIAGFYDDSNTEAAIRTALAPIFNHLIQLPELFDEKSMSSISLPREARGVLERLQTKDNNVSEQERERLNRFILEGVYSKEIAKLYGKGWRPIMFIYGGAGIFVSLFFWYFFRNRPEVHPWSNEAEHAMILKGREEVAKQAEEPLPPAPIKELAQSWNMWCCCIMQVGTNIGWIFIVTWLPRYLMDVHQVPIILRGTMTMIPTLVGLVGMYLGGMITDRLVRSHGLKWGRRLPIACSRMTAVLAYLACIIITWSHVAGHGSAWHTAWAFTGLFAVVAVSTDMGTASSWAFNQDIGGRQVGSVLGWGNMWGNLGAAAAVPLYNWVLGENPTLTDWNKMFAICMCAFLLSFVCSLMIDASKPIIPENDSEESKDSTEEQPST